MEQKVNVRLVREVDKLKKNILGLGAMVEEQLHNAIKALTQKDSELAQKVIDIDTEIDRIEVEIEEECLKLMALYQPVAIDLRFIVAVLKINNDLERIGDLTTNIALRTRDYIAKNNIDVPFDFPAMADKVKIMVRNSLDSLVNMDVDMAKQVCGADSEVDKMHRDMHEDFEEMTTKTPAKIKTLTPLLGVSRFLERIADHATNIAEDVIYMIDGEIVRHGKI